MATAPKAAKPKRATRKAAPKAPPVEPKRRGRPSTFDQKIADEIAERIGDGEPLRQICRDERMPAWRTVYDWKANNADFSARIAHAREAGYDAIAQECLEIADETSLDTILTKDGERANTEWISRSKLRIETRLKLLSKWDPKRYGDKLDLNHGGQAENPLNVLLQAVAAKGGKLPVKPQE